MPVTRREQWQRIGCARAVVLAETTSAPQGVAGGSGSGGGSTLRPVGSNEFVTPLKTGFGRAMERVL
jgi:hypothetical protein